MSNKKKQNKSPVQLKSTEQEQVVEQKTEATSVADLDKLRAQLKAKKELARQVERDQKFYSKYGHVINGSIREPSAEERDQGFVHGRICDIKCACGNKRTINTQDAFQVTHCKDCFKNVKKQEARQKRQDKRNSPEALLAQKNKLEAQLAQIQGKVA